MEGPELLRKLLTPKVKEADDENILYDTFYEKIIYNGPPRTENRSAIFHLLAANMGKEFAIMWAFDLSGVKLFDYIKNPSRKVINKAISLNTYLYQKYKTQLTEDDLIAIVQMDDRSLIPRRG